jgi:hypothetical protein
MAGAEEQMANILDRRTTRAAWLMVAALAVATTASAQVDLAGQWNTLPRNQDGSGMTGEAAGVPLSQEGQWRAQSWSPEDFDVAEWVCRPHSFDYGLEGGLSRMRVWADVDRPTQKVVSINAHANQEEQETYIYMDGRPRPPQNAVHTWSGFSTGEWDGEVLVVTTTHLKEAYIRRSGLMRSDKTVVRTRWRRMGDYLQATTIMYDPVLLAEPYIRTTMMWINDPTLFVAPYPCEEATEVAIPRGTTPHYLPGQSLLDGLNPKKPDRFGTPYQARLGGPETMYPEYIEKMKKMPRLVAPPAAPGGGRGGRAGGGGGQQQ